MEFDIQTANLDALEKAIAFERQRRILESCRTRPDTAYVTTQPGFTGPEGRVVYCIEAQTKGERTKRGGVASFSQFCFSDSPDGEGRWLVSEGDLGRKLRYASAEDLECVGTNGFVDTRRLWKRQLGLEPR